MLFSTRCTLFYIHVVLNLKCFFYPQCNCQLQFIMSINLSVCLLVGGCAHPWPPIHETLVPNVWRSPRPHQCQHKLPDQHCGCPCKHNLGFLVPKKVFDSHLALNLEVYSKCRLLPDLWGVCMCVEIRNVHMGQWRVSWKLIYNKTDTFFPPTHKSFGIVQNTKCQATVVHAGIEKKQEHIVAKWH